MSNGETTDARLERIEQLLEALLRRDMPYRDAHIAQMLVPGDGLGRARGVSSLAGFLDGGHQIVVCDPYLFHGDVSNMNDLDRIIPKSATYIEVFAQHPGGDLALLNDLARRIRVGREISELRVFWTKAFHDRVWIRKTERSVRACCVGPSLNGLGKRPSFILRLSRDDIRNFEDVLQDVRCDSKSQAA